MKHPLYQILYHFETKIAVESSLIHPDVGERIEKAVLFIMIVLFKIDPPASNSERGGP